VGEGPLSHRAPANLKLKTRDGEWEEQDGGEKQVFPLCNIPLGLNMLEIRKTGAEMTKQLAGKKKIG